MTGTYEWRFELGGFLSVKDMNLGLIKSSEGPFFLAGLWDADGSWSPPDESHRFGQARILGGSHTVQKTKHLMLHYMGIKCGRMYVATHEGHRSNIGTYVITTRTNVYGTGVLAKSMEKWIQLVGSKMLLKGRRDLCHKWVPKAHNKSFTP